MTIVLRGSCARRRGCPGTIDPNHCNEGPLTRPDSPDRLRADSRAGGCGGRAAPRRGSLHRAATALEYEQEARSLSGAGPLHCPLE